MFKSIFKGFPLVVQKRNQLCYPCTKPQHLICFKQWTADMVMRVLESAINLKCFLKDSHGKRLDILRNCKIMILQEVNCPQLNAAVSKAASLLGAYHMSIVDDVVWEYDYNGRIFSYMSDAIFVATKTHFCIQRFAEQSLVPVLCMMSRTHASIQALATIMAIIEEFGTLKSLNISYVGPPHPVLNSYLLLSPMLGANIRFKCCCPKVPVSPLLMKACEKMTSESHTVAKQCTTTKDALFLANVVISGPSPSEEKLEEFRLQDEMIDEYSKSKWIYFHTGPRGQEVNDRLFQYHHYSRTFQAFENMHYIAAALMANCIKNYAF